VKLIRSTIPLIFALGLIAPFASAQSVDAYFGVGTATDSSSGNSIDTFGTGNPFTTPKLGGAFGKAGADVMLTPYIGVNADVDFRFTHGAYAGLGYRPIFYDFNAIFAPTGRRLKRVVPEIQAGLGAVNLKFYTPSASFCDAFAGCSGIGNNFYESSNHFQVHLAAGLRLYATQHLFFQPQVDAHWVNNFFQFGDNWVPEYSASVGWSFGEH
jgi:hypothetical protein